MSDHQQTTLNNLETPRDQLGGHSPTVLAELRIIWTVAMETAGCRVVCPPFTSCMSRCLQETEEEKQGL